MSQQEPSSTTQEHSPDAASASVDESGKRECPICVMMRKGGCEGEFNAFMDCGIRAEKGEGDYQECLAMFDSMRSCMQRNAGVFGELLTDVEALAATNTEQPPNPEAVQQQKQHAAGAAA